MSMNMNKYFTLLVLISILFIICGCISIPSVKLSCYGDWYGYYLEIDNQRNEKVLFQVDKKDHIAIEPIIIKPLSNKRINLINSRYCKVKYYKLFKGDFKISCYNTEKSGIIFKTNKDINVILCQPYPYSRKYIYRFIITEDNIVNIDISAKYIK